MYLTLCRAISVVSWRFRTTSVAAVCAGNGISSLAHAFPSAVGAFLHQGIVVVRMRSQYTATNVG